MTKTILYFIYLLYLYFGGMITSISYSFEALGRAVWDKAANESAKFRQRSQEAWGMAAKSKAK